MKIIDEFERWKRIEDFQGNLGWISNSQLSKERFVITLVDKIYLQKFPSVNSKKIAVIEHNTIMKFFKSKEGWLLVENSGLKGWIKKNSAWGIN